MSIVKVKTKVGEEVKVVEFNYEYPATTADAVSKFGEEATNNLLHGAITLKLQALVRQKIDGEDVQALVDAWIPGVRGPVAKKSSFERAQAALSSLSAEQLAELAAKIKAAQRAAHNG